LHVGEAGYQEWDTGKRYDTEDSGGVQSVEAKATKEVHLPRNSDLDR
jgi:hypothetical protein